MTKETNYPVIVKILGLLFAPRLGRENTPFIPWRPTNRSSWHITGDPPSQHPMKVQNGPGFPNELFQEVASGGGSANPTDQLVEEIRFNDTELPGSSLVESYHIMKKCVRPVPSSPFSLLGLVINSNHLTSKFGSFRKFTRDPKRSRFLAELPGIYPSKGPEMKIW